MRDKVTEKDSIKAREREQELSIEKDSFLLKLHSARRIGFD